MPETTKRLDELSPDMHRAFDRVTLRGAYDETLWYRLSAEDAVPPLNKSGEPDWRVLVVNVPADADQGSMRDAVRRALGIPTAAW